MESLLTIGAAAREVGRSPASLRLYEAQGVIAPVREEGGGRRLYSRSEIEQLRAWLNNGRGVATAQTGR